MRLVGDHVRQARARAFVGRQAEITSIAAVLRGHDGELPGPSVFYVHGPGGIGKSALLRRIAAIAVELGRPLVQLDGRFVGDSTRTFLAAARPATLDPRAVLLVDSFERCQWLETWLRDSFLPELRQGVVVVLAGRQPPEVEWGVDPGWAQALRPLPLGPLDQEHAEELLRASGVAPSLHAALVRFSGGNPLALSLAAAVAVADPAAESTWVPSAQVLGMLLSRLVGEVPSPSHRRALEAAAQAFAMTEDLLRVALPDADTGGLFAWLRELPYMELDAHGLYPHDAVRETLAADLRWRNPQTFDATRRRLAAELLSRVREASESDALAAMGALRYLYRDTPPLSSFYAWTRQAQVDDEPLQREDLPAAMALAKAVEGDESATLVRYWFDRQPQAFRLHRASDTGEPVAFSAHLRLPAPPDPGERATDPVVAAAWQYCQDTAPVREGEQIQVLRFAVHPECYQRPSPVMNHTHWRALANTFRLRNLAYGFLVYQDADFWRERLAGRMIDTGARPVVDGRPFALFTNDWRRTPPERWIHADVEDDQHTASPAVGDGRSALSRDEFDEAVRQALLMYRHTGGLDGSVLARTALVPAGRTDVDAALRAALQQALSSLRTNSRRLRGHDAVVATYIGGAPTQQAAARRLRVPFGTYRRHLKQGVRDICDYLWGLSVDNS